MRIVRGRIVDVYLTCFILGPNIAFPEITMYQAGLDVPPIGLKSIKQSWDNRADDRLKRVRKLRPYAIGSAIVIISTGE